MAERLAKSKNKEIAYEQAKKNRLVKWDTSRQGSGFFMKLIKPIFCSLKTDILCTDVAEQKERRQNKVLKFFTLISHGWLPQY